MRILIVYFSASVKPFLLRLQVFYIPQIPSLLVNAFDSQLCQCWLTAKCKTISGTLMPTPAVLLLRVIVAVSVIVCH